MRRAEEVFGGDCVCVCVGGEAGTGKADSAKRRKGCIGKKWTGMKEAEGDKSNAQNNSDFNQQQIDGGIVSILEVIIQRHNTTLIAQFLISSTFAKHNPSHNKLTTQFSNAQFFNHNFYPTIH